jgi:hypothetical protein
MHTNRHEFLPELKTEAIDSLLRQSSEGRWGPDKRLKARGGHRAPLGLSDFFD